MRKIICVILAIFTLFLTGCEEGRYSSPETAAENFCDDVKKQLVGTNDTIEDFISGLGRKEKKIAQRLVDLIYDVDYYIISEDIDPVIQGGFVLMQITTYDFTEAAATFLSRLMFMLGTNTTLLYAEDIDEIEEKFFGILNDVLDEMELDSKDFSYTVNIPIQKIGGKWEVGSDAAVYAILKPIIIMAENGTFDHIFDYLPTMSQKIRENLTAGN